MAEWKPTYYRTNGRPGATAPLRRVAHKFLEQMKHRNEELGNYINPVHRFEYDNNKFVLSSLPGYDIVDITVPFVPGEEEKGGTAEIYSGLWEPRFQAGGFDHYLRWYPSDYEIFNSDTTDPVGLGASVDGADERLITAPLPPSRWLQNDYTYDPDDPASKEEAPWFVESGRTVAANSIHPGKYSGRLRELVQMQLGYGLTPQFNYTASNSNGLYLEDLGDDVTRIWLYQISATNGVVMQIMADYSIEKFEKEAGLKTGEIPPEIEEAGWFAVQTSFDSTKVVYTKAAWDALPADEQPPITAVTFELLSAPAYLSVTGEYGAYGDYGWSFNPAGTSAVICGIDWNDDVSPARNYRSNILTVTLNPTAFTASVVGGGDNPFLMDSANDSVKFPNANGTLETVYFWKGENGFKGTQPSASYTSPIYAYYDLTGALVQCNYTYTEGVVETRNSGSAFVLNWEETVACRQVTTFAPTNYQYSACSTGTSGTGTFGTKHGFSTSVTTPDSFDQFVGYKAFWSGVSNHGGWFRSGLKDIFHFFQNRPAALHVDSHFVDRYEGTHGATSYSVLIVPSFERLAFYHYKKLHNLMTNGKLQTPNAFWYERGSPTRNFGTGQLGEACESGCPPGNAANGNPRPDQDTTPTEYYAASGDLYDGTHDLHDIIVACAGDPPDDCFRDEDPVRTVHMGGSAPEDPSTLDTTDYVGGLVLPDGSSIAYSEDEIVNDSKPFRESSSSFGHQSVISCVDSFSSKYIFSMPNIELTDTKSTANGFPDDITESGVLFSGMPYFIG